MYYKNILETIGNTPLVQLHGTTEGLKGTILAKLEAFNPGQSAKDRIAVRMVEAAERSGELKPGATIVETTSGNTGVAVAMVSRVKGYNCILCVKDKISVEKYNMLQALGAKIVLCPSNVKPEDPRSYYSQGERLGREIPGAYYLNQNYNRLNQLAHYETTGKEIWEQTEGCVTHFIASTGTGGTISGVAQYLKEKNPKVEVIGVDAFGSALKPFHETGIYDPEELFPTRMEGVGKNIIPGNVDFHLIDEFVQVRDVESALRARDLALKDGILAGYSSGAVLQCLHQIKRRLTKKSMAVLLFSDHGSRYLTKVFSKEWMEEQFEVKLHEPAAIERK
jgi:cystathionine beta-synthase